MIKRSGHPVYAQVGRSGGKNGRVIVLSGSTKVAWIKMECMLKK